MICKGSEYSFNFSDLIFVGKCNEENKFSLDLIFKNHALNLPMKTNPVYSFWETIEDTVKHSLMDCFRIEPEDLEKDDKAFLGSVWNNGYFAVNNCKSCSREYYRVQISELSTDRDISNILHDDGEDDYCEDCTKTLKNWNDLDEKIRMELCTWYKAKDSLTGAEKITLYALWEDGCFYYDECGHCGVPFRRALESDVADDLGEYENMDQDAGVGRLCFNCYDKYKALKVFSEEKEVSNLWKKR